MIDQGSVRRIRGIWYDHSLLFSDFALLTYILSSYTTRMSPQTAARVIEGAREVLGQYCEDVYIYTDHYKGGDAGAYAFYLPFWVLPQLLLNGCR